MVAARTCYLISSFNRLTIETLHTRSFLRTEEIQPQYSATDIGIRVLHCTCIHKIVQSAYTNQHTHKYTLVLFNKESTTYIQSAWISHRHVLLKQEMYHYIYIVNCLSCQLFKYISSFVQDACVVIIVTIVVVLSSLWRFFIIVWYDGSTFDGLRLGLFRWFLRPFFLGMWGSFWPSFGWLKRN